MIFSSFLHAISQCRNICKSSDIVSDISIDFQNKTTHISGGNTLTFDASQLHPYSQIRIPFKNSNYIFEKLIIKTDAQTYLSENIYLQFFVNYR
jgi:hypothetical protein